MGQQWLVFAESRDKRYDILDLVVASSHLQIEIQTVVLDGIGWATRYGYTEIVLD